MKLTLLAIISIVFSSCVEHQYLTFSGANINKTDNSEFVSENDTVKVLYHFKPYHGRIFVSVFNRTDEPLVVDWWKSAIVIGEKSFSYYNPDVHFSGQIAGNTSGIRKSYYNADMSGTAHLSEASNFIPSHSWVNKEIIVFSIDTLTNLPEPEAKKDTIRLSNDGTISYKKISFEKDRSPLSFHSYLTFRIGKANEEKEFSLKHQFYVSEVWKIRSSLQNLPERITSRGDMIYLTP